MTVTDSILNRARNGIKASSSISVQRMEMVDQQKAGVLFYVGPDIKSEKALADSVAKAWGSKVRLMENSAFYPVENNSTLISAFVILNNESKVFEAASLTGMSAVTANVFRDDKDRIWKKVGEDATAMLTRESDDDLKALLEARHSSSLVTASVDARISEPFQAYEGVGWYDFTSAKMRYGVTLAMSGAVLDLESARITNVPARQIVLAADLRNEEMKSLLKPKEPLAKDNALQMYVDYIHALYKHRPEYFAKLLDVLKKGFGRSALPAPSNV